jgi:transcriptional regulator with XRE-family HTH domain
MTAEQFRAARERLNMSQSQLAEAMGISLRTVQAKEKGARPVRLADEKMLAKLRPAARRRTGGNPNLIAGKGLRGEKKVKKST